MGYNTARLRRFPRVDPPKSPDKLGDFVRLLAPLKKGSWGDQNPKPTQYWDGLMKSAIALLILIHENHENIDICLGAQCLCLS